MDFGGLLFKHKKPPGGKQYKLEKADRYDSQWLEVDGQMNLTSCCYGQKFDFLHELNTPIIRFSRAQMTECAPRVTRPLSFTFDLPMNFPTGCTHDSLAAAMY